MRQRHALFVAFHVPPEASSSGVLRTLKYIRYLEESNWRVTVVCPDTSAYAVTDPSLVRQLPDSCRVVRTPFLNTKRHLSVFGLYPVLLAVPDTWIGWLPWGIAAGKRVAREDPIDLVYSTSPHATAHLIASSVATNAARPWVTDFRDPWFEEIPEPGAPSGPLFRGIDRRLERRVIMRCQCVTTSTLSLRDTFRERYPDVPPGKFVAILNGYDEADFSALPTVSAPGNRLTLVHAGVINGEFRDPRPLFVALRECIDRGEVRADELRVRFLGGGAFADSSEVRSGVEATGLAASVEFLPRVPYAEALQELAAADVLLLLQSSPDTTGLVPAKLYEYLRAQKPVLALVQPGATGEILRMVNGGWAIDPADTGALRAGIGEIVQRWRNASLRDACADLNDLRRFDRRSLAKELAGVFESLVPA